MIKKELKVPIKIKKLEALLKRLPNNHSRRIEIQDELARSIAGFKGEKSLDYYFDLLPSQDNIILHNLRLPNINSEHFFQIDLLMLTPFFILIIEVKNISGTLTFDPAFDQLIWTTLDKEIALPDPVRQVKNQRFQLIEWLKSKNLPTLPVETVVVLTNTSGIIKINSEKNDYIQNIIRSSKFLAKIDFLKKRYPKELINYRDMNKLSTQLIKRHTPACPDFLERYNIQKSEILTGVYCNQCTSFCMRYKKGNWMCPTCSTKGKGFHLDALNDYSLLIDPVITNRQVKGFLQLSTSDIAYYLLQTMNLKHTGTYKDRMYYLPPVDMD